MSPIARTRVLVIGLTLAAAVAGAQAWRLGTDRRPDGPMTAEAAAPEAAAAARAWRKQARVRGLFDSPGKPQAPIEFSYRLLGPPAVGQPLGLRIEFGLPIGARDLNVTLAGDERIWVPSEAARIRLQGSAVAAARGSRMLEIVPLAGGRSEVRVLLEATIGGRVQARAVTIPIGTGPAAAGPSAVSVDASGQPIIVLPAAED